MTPKPATFLELHQAQGKILRALEPLPPDDKTRVLYAILKSIEEEEPPASAPRGVS